MIPTVVVHCRALGRSLDHIHAAIPDAIVFDAPFASEQHAGCIAGHQYAVQLAREKHWNAVGVVEDDCQFTDAFQPGRWAEDLEWARQHGYSMLNGGCIRAAHPKPVRKGLVAVDRFKSTHCVAYLPAAFDIVDKLVYPMDVMLGRLGAKALVTVPFVAYQAPGVSSHLQAYADNTEEYRMQEARLGGLTPCKS